MPYIKCGYCGLEKPIRNYLKNYAYKRKLKASNKTIYFCSYECMRKAETKQPDKFSKE